MGARMATVGALRLALEALGQVFQLVQDFREGGKLMALQGFVEYFHTCCRVIDAVVVFVRVLMQIVVFQQQVFAKQPSDVAERVSADAERVAEVARVKPDLHFKGQVIQANHLAD